MFNSVAFQQRGYFDEYVCDEFRELCRQIIMEATYYCGKCGMSYDSGLPTVDVAWNHLLGHFNDPLWHGSCKIMPQNIIFDTMPY